MIHILPPEVANKIAAGEVVERPASIVKELLENALDAGATRIEVVVEAAGSRLIQVSDNGHGLNEEDCRLCLLRHATSKIEKAEDLFALRTMGFRGEALASIASVSQFSFVTKIANAPHGFSVTSDDHGRSLVTPAPANQGTVVTVNNLFYNVPARKKFLKAERTEFIHILKTMENFAMIHSSCELRLNHNGKEIFHYLPETFDSRIRAVLGELMFRNMIPVSMTTPEFSFQGFISKPILVHGTHHHQHLFINHRPVYDHQVSRAILDAYATLIPRGYFPAFVLALTLPHAQVDVNVHPRKSEVRFLDFIRIRGLLISGLREVLSRADIVPHQSFPVQRTFSSPGAGQHTAALYRQSFPSQGNIKSALPFFQDFLGGTRSLRSTLLEERHYRILGQLHHSFIIVETPDGVQIFDQHAVSEIVNYHRLITEREKGHVESQQLLLPVPIDVNAEKKHILEENLDLLKILGWDSDFLTDKTIQITAAPSILKNEKIDESLLAIIEILSEGGTIDRDEKEHQLLKLEACRGAVMFGDALTIEEMTALLNQWLSTDDNEACEHGRPSVAMITVEEMKNFFRR